MTIITDGKKKLLKAISSIDGIIKQEAVKNTKFIANLNREQLLRGEKGDGSSMPDYDENSKQPNAPGKIVLFDKGDFQQGIEPMFNDDGGEMVSTDRKTPFLEKKYGNILDLSPDSKKKLSEKLKPGIIKRLKKL